MNTPAAHRPLLRLAQLEVLRVLAMTGVFLFHLWSVLPFDATSGAFGLVLGRVFSFGYLGVVVFNIVTGFVLALPYLGPEPRRVPPYGDFLRRRFLRICPPYYLALLLWTATALLTACGHRGSFVLTFVTHALFLHTLHPATFFGIVPAYWWLGLLAQFYLLFPLVLRLFLRLGPGWSGLGLCGICWLGSGLLARLAALQPDTPWAMINYLAYFNLPARLPEFVIGMWLAAAWNPSLPSGSGRVPVTPRRVPLAPSFAVFVLGMLLFVILGSWLLPLADTPLWHLYLVAWCVVGVVVLFLWSPVARLGTSRMVTSVAAASYSIYLVHQPLLDCGHQWLAGRLSLPAEFGLLLVGRIFPPPFSWISLKAKGLGHFSHYDVVM